MIKPTVCPNCGASLPAIPDDDDAAVVCSRCAFAVDNDIREIAVPPGLVRAGLVLGAAAAIVALVIIAGSATVVLQTRKDPDAIGKFVADTRQQSLQWLLIVSVQLVGTICQVASRGLCCFVPLGGGRRLALASFILSCVAVLIGITSSFIESLAFASLFFIVLIGVSAEVCHLLCVRRLGAYLFSAGLVRRASAALRIFIAVWVTTLATVVAMVLYAWHLSTQEHQRVLQMGLEEMASTARHRSLLDPTLPLMTLAPLAVYALYEFWYLYLVYRAYSTLGSVPRPAKRAD